MAVRLLEQAGTGRRYIYTDALATRADMKIVEVESLVPVTTGAPADPAEPAKAKPRGRPPKEKVVPVLDLVQPEPETAEPETADSGDDAG